MLPQSTIYSPALMRSDAAGAEIENTLRGRADALQVIDDFDEAFSGIPALRRVPEALNRVNYACDGYAKVKPTSSLLLELEHHSRFRSHSLDRDTEFSWIRGAVFLFSYLLFLTDMFRTSIAICKVNLTALEPSVYASFGPYGYPVAHIPWNATSDEMARVWSYKFDTTSVAIRSVAQFFHLASWPPCMVYKSHCKGNMITYLTVFGMLDSLAESVSQLKVKRRGEKPSISLRAENAYFDRLNEYVLPFFFQVQRVRTVQALYYDVETVANERFQFCGRGFRQPYACGDNWINFQVTCGARNTPCLDSRLIWKDIAAKTRAIAKMYSGLHVDLLLIEGYEDRRASSLSLQGDQLYDVTVITRVRNCSHGTSSKNSQCQTVVVDDHRYEGESISTNVVDWCYVITAIRIVGQSYAYLRIASLFLACYKVRSAEPEFIHASHLTRSHAALRTMFRAPSQVVVYGSMIPVFAYTIAHLIDCSMVYERVFEEFTSLVGKFHFDLPLFIRVGTVSMRTLWLFAAIFHVVLLLRTRGPGGPTNKGVPGIPEFTLSATAFLTISAQFRSLSFRNSNVISVLEMVPSVHGRSLRTSRYNNTRSMAYIFCLGDTLDAKYLTACILVVTSCLVLIYGLVRLLSKLRLVQSHDLTLWPHTMVSCAAGTLWPVNALMVSWHGSVLTPVRVKQYMLVKPTLDIQRKNSISVTDASNPGKVTTELFIVNRSEESRSLQNAITCLDGRSPAVKATLYLMNLALMSDPVVLSRLYWFGGQDIGIYRSSRLNDQLYFLPMAVEKSEQNFEIDVSQMELLGVVNTMDLPWVDLLQCG